MKLSDSELRELDLTDILIQTFHNGCIEEEKKRKYFPIKNQRVWSCSPSCMYSQKFSMCSRARHRCVKVSQPLRMFFTQIIWRPIQPHQHGAHIHSKASPPRYYYNDDIC